MDTHEALWSVNVLAGNILKISDTEGKAVFMLTKGEHTIEYKKLSYQEEYATIMIHSDSVYDFFLTRTHAYLKFRLLYESTPVNNAMVKTGMDSLLSNSLGIANFQQLEVPELYEYEITSDEFETVVGSIELTTDTELEIEMVKKPTFVSENPHHSFLRIWPNPTNGPLYITFSKTPEDAEFRISDLNGQTFIREIMDAEEKEISLDFLDKGLYMIHFVSKKENLVYLLVRI